MRKKRLQKQGKRTGVNEEDNGNWDDYDAYYIILV